MNLQKSIQHPTEQLYFEIRGAYDLQIIKYIIKNETITLADSLVG